MNRDLAVDSADWRALFGVRWRRLNCLFVHLSSTFQRAAEDGFAADDASVSGDGHTSRCCTLGEFWHHCDCVSVIGFTKKCHEKGLGTGSGQRNVRCRQFGVGSLRLSLRAGFLEKAREGAQPQLFRSMLRVNRR